ncbi:hypothetical protein [Burkholderia multivorans]|uniref:hypothetical protein n=1 Tax=Burkholderia multivorans TaxID=87883 RepID=UPI0021BFBA84|nr:hypothetical protein [Burkholderia multivorans]
MDNALTVGGDANAEQFGRDLGDLVWQTVSVVTAAKGAVGASVTLGRVGLDVTAGALETLARRAPPLVTGTMADMAGSYRFTADQLPALTNIWRNDGQLGERLSSQLMKEATGQNFVPIQNASGHGIDLVYIDQQTKTTYHVEVKTVTGDRIPITPADDLTDRFSNWISQTANGNWSAKHFNRICRTRSENSGIYESKQWLHSKSQCHASADSSAGINGVCYWRAFAVAAIAVREL